MRNIKRREERSACSSPKRPKLTATSMKSRRAAKGTFGSVTNVQIAEALSASYAVDRKSICIDEPIRLLGRTTCPSNLRGIEAKVTVVVVKTKKRRRRPKRLLKKRRSSKRRKSKRSRRRPRSNVATIKQRKSTPVFDRVPPQSIEAERSVLGAMLLNPEAVGTAIEILKDDAVGAFYAEPHQLIYTAIVGLYRDATPVDVVTLVERLNRDGAIEKAGGPSYIADLSGAVPTSANVEHYAKIVLDAAVLRRLISACSNLAGEAYESPDDAVALLDKAEAAMFSIAETRQLSPIYPVGDLVSDAIDRIDAIMRSHKEHRRPRASTNSIYCSRFPAFRRSSCRAPSVTRPPSLNIASHVAIHEKKSVLGSASKCQRATRPALALHGGRHDSQRLRSATLRARNFRKCSSAQTNSAQRPSLSTTRPTSASSNCAQPPPRRAAASISSSSTISS